MLGAPQGDHGPAHGDGLHSGTRHRPRGRVPYLVAGRDRCYDGARSVPPGRRSESYLRRPGGAMTTEQRSPATSYPAAGSSDPTIGTTIGDALRLAARRWGQRTALVAPGADGHRRTWTFEELLSHAERSARALLQRFGPGEHVAIWAANSPEWPLVEFGAALAGLTLVTVNPAYRSAELSHVLRQSKAVGVLIQPRYRGADLMAAVESVRPDLPGLRDVVNLSRWDEFLASGRDADLPAVASGDIAQIQYPSGTTGFPKGAMLPHRGLVVVSRMFAEVNGAGPADV